MSNHPEWLGYCAAFDAYGDAKARGDEENAKQAQVLMAHFARPLIERKKRTDIRHRTTFKDDLSDLLGILGI